MLLPFPKIGFCKNRRWSVCPSTGASYSDDINCFPARFSGSDTHWSSDRSWVQSTWNRWRISQFLTPHRQVRGLLSVPLAAWLPVLCLSLIFSSAWGWSHLNCSVFPEHKSSNVVGNTSAIAVPVFERKKFFWWVFPFLPVCSVCCLFGFCFVFWFFFLLR